MSDAWIEPFLRDRRVAVLAIPRAGRSPLATPVWYDYDGTQFCVQVEGTSAKARAFAGSEALPVALTIQSEAPPYRYAVVHGRATLGPNVSAGLRRRLARRYFGRIGGDLYVGEQEKQGVDDAALRRIRIVPERTVSHDFRPEAGRIGRLYFRIYRWLRPSRA